MASGVAAGGGGSPPRATSQDPRLADMPDELSRSEKSAYIIDKCNLKDEMWTLVYCLSKKGVNVRWQCKLRGVEGTSTGVFTGGPAKIRCHYLDDQFGCVTCTAAGPEREEATKLARTQLNADIAAKEKRLAEKERKRKAEEARLRADSAKRQAKLGAGALVRRRPLSTCRKKASTGYGRKQRMLHRPVSTTFRTRLLSRQLRQHRDSCFRQPRARLM